MGDSRRYFGRAVLSRVRCKTFASGRTGAAEPAGVDPIATPDAVDLLVRRKASLLVDLERRLGSREDAEDLLQDALLRVVRKWHSLRTGERVAGWFHRVLQNLVVDCYRRRAASKRLGSRLMALAPEAVPSDGELFEQVCGCIRDVLTTLRPAYAEMLRRIELGEEPLRGPRAFYHTRGGICASPPSAPRPPGRAATDVRRVLCAQLPGLYVPQTWRPARPMRSDPVGGRMV
jgi:hypothetical protein